LQGGKPVNYTYTDAAMAAMAVHCSQRERRAEEAERDVDERFRCAWMAKHVGEEFEGTVTGVTSFGLFVELDESKVSGLVHISQLSNDYYHFDPVRHLLKGERTGLQFRLGDHVRVQVLRASLEDRKIDFRLVQEAKGAPASAPTATRAYDYSAAGERYSLPSGRNPLPSLPPLPGRDNASPKHGNAKPSHKAAKGKGVKAAGSGKPKPAKSGKKHKSKGKR
jgi:ribonuclease R